MIVAAVRRITRLPIDVHLMIENPDRYIPDFIDAGADWISVQVEACPHLNRSVQLIKQAGAKAGVVLNPSTPLSALDWILEEIDYVLIMSVNPGFGGQSFITSSLRKIRELHRTIHERKLSVRVEVDGGVNVNTIGDVAKAGADVFVAGSAIFGSRDYRRVIEQFRALMGE